MLMRWSVAARHPHRDAGVGRKALAAPLSRGKPLRHRALQLSNSCAEYPTLRRAARVNSLAIECCNEVWFLLRPSSSSGGNFDRTSSSGVVSKVARNASLNNAKTPQQSAKLGSASPGPRLLEVLHMFLGTAPGVALTVHSSRLSKHRRIAGFLSLHGF